VKRDDESNASPSLMWVLLWTDGLFFVLVATTVIYAYRVRRHAHLRAPWRQVARSRSAMGAAVVLAAYVAVALLDSVHFHPRVAQQALSADGAQYSPEILSVFDWLAAPLKERSEKTYSAPFAVRLYGKEPVTGAAMRAYPRLKHGGAHLDEPQDRARDIALTGLQGTMEGLLVTGLLGFAVLAWLARRRSCSLREVLSSVSRGSSPVPWRTILGSAALMVVVAFVCFRLSGKYFILGTDKIGQDVFFHALKSIRVGIIIGTLTTLIMLPFAVLLGITAGYFRGWVDDLVQYLYTTLSSIPGVLLVAAAILMMQVYMANHPDSFGTLAERADLRLLFLCMILGITSWTGLCRLLRGEVLKLRESDYVQAAVALGVGRSATIFRHLMPGVMHVLLITVVLDFSVLVLAEAVLSYVNIGVDPSTISWGNMINGARLEMAREPIVWWSLAAAMLFMFGLVLAANLFADAVRDAFDPRVRIG
jgi:peptide/nickel transport system permease protein